MKSHNLMTTTINKLTAPLICHISSLRRVGKTNWTLKGAPVKSIVFAGKKYNYGGGELEAAPAKIDIFMIPIELN